MQKNLEPRGSVLQMKNRTERRGCVRLGQGEEGVE